MKRIAVSSILFLFVIFYIDAQNLELSFTGVVDQSYIQLDSIKIMNRTQGGDTLLLYPDTVLMLTAVGITDPVASQTMHLSENHPNPYTEETLFRLSLPAEDQVHLVVHDGMGRTVAHYNSLLTAGSHDFTLRGGNTGWYILTASASSRSQSIKLSCLGSGSQPLRVVKVGDQPYKSTFYKTEMNTFFPFAAGDQMLYVGYVSTFTGVLESGILDSITESQDYTFHFASNIPCPGTPTIDYEGQTYNTIQVFSQCWLKENLNVGSMIQGNEEMTDNEIVEKYCYDNEPDSCDKYGGLYQWDEMMQYTTQEGTQGICPPGWHLPSDEEWKVLEGAVDSQYGIGDNTWDDDGFRGFDAGTNLKTTSGWQDNGNGTDLFGFSGLPGGARSSIGYFSNVGYYGLWGASSESYYDYPWSRGLHYYFPEVLRGYDFKAIGFSARCLRDN